jgi:hypothetical protein
MLVSLMVLLWLFSQSRKARNIKIYNGNVECCAKVISIKKQATLKQHQLSRASGGLMRARAGMGDRAGIVEAKGYSTAAHQLQSELYDANIKKCHQKQIRWGPSLH